jgi:hypothetical protein
MQRTRRDARFDGQVRRTLLRREGHHEPAPDPGRTDAAHRLYVSEQMARWETEGGALGRTAAQRPRPFP